VASAEHEFSIRIFIALENWDEEEPVPIDHPDLPDDIRELFAPWYLQGACLHRALTNTGVEWWILDADGELVDAYW
jgi:hypothetical protein